MFPTLKDEDQMKVIKTIKSIIYCKLVWICSIECSMALETPSNFSMNKRSSQLQKII